MSTRGRMGIGAFLAIGLLVAVLLAVLVGPRASSKPDGLEKVAIDKGFDGHGRDSATADLPTADYAVRGVDDDGLSTGLAGLIGVVATFAVGGGLLLAARRLSTRRSSGRPVASPGP